jgi:hypothetical protein
MTAGRTIRATAPPTGHGRVSEEIRKAVARGALTRERAALYLAKAADYPEQGEAVADLVSQLWGPGQGLPVDTADPDGIMAAMWPEDPPGPPHEPDWLAMHDARRVRLTSQASGALTGQLPGAAPPPPGYGALDGGAAEPVPGHGAMTTEHEHEHSDYAGGQHTHPHIHRNDKSHEPGAGHGYGSGAGDQVAAGIDRMAARQAAASARKPVTAMTDEELMADLGYPPGR